MQKILKRLLVVLFLSLLFAVPTKAASIEDAISNAYQIANDNSHGYSQDSRWGPDYDCSSFIYTVFHNAGFGVPFGNGYTQTMPQDFQRAGFTYIPWSSIGGVSGLRRGDILLNNSSNRAKQHTELYLGNSQIIGAHRSYGYRATGDQTGKEISQQPYYNHPWLCVLRYGGATPPEYKTGVWQVDTAVLNVRSGPGVSNSRLGEVYSGSRYNVTEISGSWGKIKYNGQDAWICLDFCKRIGDLPSIGFPNIKAWLANTRDGGEATDFRPGTDIYLRYELVDPASGKRYSEAGGTGRYSVKETIYDAAGRPVSQYTYNNSDNNFVGIRGIAAGSYTAVVEVSGDFKGSAQISFDIIEAESLTMDAWISETENGPEVQQMKAKHYYYLCYRLYDKSTGKPLNEVLKKNYKVTLHTYGDDAEYEDEYNNQDSGCMKFYPAFVGRYVGKVTLSGDISAVEETVRYSIDDTSVHYYGDLDYDGLVGETDLDILRGIIVESVELTEDLKKRADLNGSGEVDIVDISIMRSFLNGEIDVFPVEKAVLKGITLTSVPMDPSCMAGDALPLAGITVQAYYSDGSTKTITDYQAEGSTETPGPADIIISYTEDGVTASTTYSINVYENKIQDCDISFNPNASALDVMLGGLTITNGSTVLEEGTDYTISTTQLSDDGQTMLVIQGLGAYSGSISSVVSITKEKAVITGVPETWNAETQTDFLQLNPSSNAGTVFRYQSSDENVAAVTWDGAVYPVGEGTSDITVLIPESDSYYAGSAVMHVTVTASDPEFWMDKTEFSVDEETFWLPLETDSEGALTFSSDSDELLTITEEGEVHLKGKEGTAIINVRSAATNRFKAGNKDFTITLSKNAEDTGNKPDDPKPENRPQGTETNASENTDHKDNTSGKGDDGTDLGKGASVTAAVAALTSSVSDEGPSGTIFNQLRLRMKSTSGKSVRIRWNKVIPAKKYLVFGAKCKTHFKKLAEVNGTGYTHKNLKKGTYYKYLVIAVDDADKVITSSKTAYIATGKGKFGNNRAVKITGKKKFVLKPGKKARIKAKLMPDAKKKKVKKYRKLSYESSNPEVAEVAANGRITALRKGTCKIYIYAQDGVYKTVSVKVK